MKHTHRTASFLICSCFLFLFLTWPSSLPSLAAQDIQVNSADPPSAPQATLNLNVTIKGKGFKRGAGARFFVSGTTDPGGIRVNSTTFKGPTELVANIDVADNATIAKFDIEVQNSDGRIGKGIELFSVTAKGSPTCETSSLPTGFSPVTKLNPDPPAFTGEFGRSVSVGQVDLNLDGTADAFVVAVGSRVSGRIEVFLLNPATGQVLAGHPHITLASSPPDTGFGAGVAIGDVNGDSVPDIAAYVPDTLRMYVFLGAVSGQILAYPEAITFSVPVDRSSHAIGDVTGDGLDEVIVGARSAGTGGKVLVFKFDPVSRSFAFFREITSPTARQGDAFGSDVAVGDVTGSTANDLVVGAYGVEVGKTRDAGVIFVFPGPLPASGDLPSPIQLTTGKRDDKIGYRVTVGNVDGDLFQDVLGVAYLSPPAVIFKGLVNAGQSADIVLTLDPALGATQGYGTNIDSGDINGDGLAEVLVAAPNASDNTGRCMVGAAYVYLSSPDGPVSQRFMLQPSNPTDTALLFGWSVAALPGTRFFLVGEPGRKIGDFRAGQVYVFRRD